MRPFWLSSVGAIPICSQRFVRIVSLFVGWRNTFELSLQTCRDEEVSFLARKIGRAKWDTPEGFEAGEIGADAISSDLKTTSNRLSFWTCTDANDVELEKATLAIVAGRDDVDRVDIAWLSEADVRDSGLNTSISPGSTPVPSLRSRHTDIVRLDYVRLGRVASLISNAVSAGECKRFTKAAVLRLLCDAVDAGEVALDDLCPKVRDAVAKSLGRPT